MLLMLAILAVVNDQFAKDAVVMETLPNDALVKS